MATLGEKIRLDELLCRRGCFPSRQRAAAAIMSGIVLVEGRRVDKPGVRVPPDTPVELQEPDHPYVSRGGLKLERALRIFAPPLAGQVALDVGASTGGFTHCLLLHGVARVYALDVGYGQLAWELRRDSRVVVLERCNVRHLSARELPEPVGLVTVDVSFISLRLVFPALTPFLSPEASLLTLVKPQFEAGKRAVGRGGVVRDRGVQQEVLQRVMAEAAGHDLAARGLTYSPLSGPRGNREFWLHLQRGQGTTATPNRAAIARVVQEAWEQVR